MNTIQKQILDNCLFNRTTEFHSGFVNDEGKYLQAQFNRHIIKVYDKRKDAARKGGLSRKRGFEV